MSIDTKKIVKGVQILKETDLTTSIEIVPAGSTNTKTTIQSSQTTNKTLILPDATDTLLGATATQSVSNKTFDNTNTLGGVTISGSNINNTPIGATTPSTGNFTSLAATSATVSGVTVTTNTATQTLTNKSLSDSTTAIVDVTDTTKQIKFDAGGATSTSMTIASIQSTNKTLTLPDITDTLVTKNSVDRLTNKSLEYNSTQIVDPVDITKQINFQPAGATGTTTTIKTLANANRTVTLPDATDTLLGRNTTDTLTNKTLQDSTTIITNSADATRQIKFSSGGSPSTTTTINVSSTANRSITLPNATTTLVGIDTTDTLTNKTLTSPVINTPTGITKSDVGLANVDNTSDVTKNAATVTLTNKSLSDSTTAIVDVTDSTKKILFDAAGTTATSTTILSSQTTNKILTLPDITDTLVTKTSTDILTNKDIDGATASNSSRITLPKNTTTNLTALTRKQGTLVYDTTLNKPYYDDGTTLKLIGSGSGGGGINYLSSNPDAEVNTTGWAVYANTAQTTPVTGTGGVPNSTLTRTTTSPLRGSGSFLFTVNSGASRQGEGFSYDFTIDTSDKAKVLQISFDYIINSGTFVAGSSGVDSDLTVYIYDVTNALLIQPSSYKLLSNSTNIADKFNATFQTASNSTSYRLIIHRGQTSTTGFTVMFDNFNVGPSTYVYGTPITDWQSFVPTILADSGGLSLGTGATQAGYWRRVGDSIEVTTTIVAGTASTATGTGNYYFPLPGTFTPDNTRIYNSGLASGVSPIIGVAETADSGGTVYSDGSVVLDGTNSRVRIFDSTGTAYSATVRAIAASRRYTIRYSVPVLGWSSSIQTSDQADTRVVAFYAPGQLATGTITATASVAKLATISKDTHGLYNPTTGLYTVAIPGYYQLFGCNNISSTTTAVNQYNATGFLVNGSVLFETFNAIQSTSVLVMSTNSTGLVYCNAGDTIGLSARANTTTPVYSTSSSGSYLSINRVSGPSAIAATESIIAIYTMASSGGTVATGTSTAVSNALVSFSKVRDTHGIFNTTSGQFTVPIAGIYSVNANLEFNTNATGLRQVIIQQTGSASVSRTIGLKEVSTATTATIAGGIARFNCLAGDVIALVAFQNSGSSLTIAPAGAQNSYIELMRIGN